MSEVLSEQDLNTIVWDEIKNSQNSDDFIGFIKHAKGSEADFETAYDLAEKYWNAPKSESQFNRAVSKLEARASAGCTTSMLHLGIWHRLGYGVPVDSDKGLAWYKAGMELMDARCFMAYAMGISSTDPDTAKHLYKRSSELGHKLAHAYWADIDKENYMQHLAESSKSNDPLALYLYALELVKRAEKAHETEHALDIMKRAANQGSTNAAFYLGMIYFYGEQGRTVDKPTAEYWYKKGIRRGDFNCYAALGIYLIYANVDRSEEATKSLTRGAIIGDRHAQYHLGMHLMLSGANEEDRAKGLTWVTTAAENGMGGAYYFLGQSYSSGASVEANQELANYWYKRGAAAGHTLSQCALGLALVHGEGLEKDPEQAHNLFHAAHLQGSGWGSYLLAMSYKRGDGCEKDARKSFEYFKEGAVREDTSATFYLASAYFYGEGVEENLPAALKWFKKASDMGSAVATYYLGMMFLNSTGVTYDFEKALQLLNQAADGGSETAMRELGLIYFNGDKVPHNMELAKRWMAKAAANADPVAIDWIKKNCPEKPDWLNTLLLSTAQTPNSESSSLNKLDKTE